MGPLRRTAERPPDATVLGQRTGRTHAAVRAGAVVYSTQAAKLFDNAIMTALAVMFEQAQVPKDDKPPNELACILCKHVKVASLRTALQKEKLDNSGSVQARLERLFAAELDALNL